MEYAKAYAAALVAIVLYVVHGLTTGEWASAETIAPALAILLTPVVVWAVPNEPAGYNHTDHSDLPDRP